ncbi:MAG: ribosomal biogenesis protein [Candidatus Thermoplasmatota archaeon]|nr:ribosomal biogenesis protein [Candidatus Thermoplasmatota archaeon]
MILVTKWFGAFLCDDGKVRKAALFPKDPAEIARRLAQIKRGEVLPEESSLAPSAKKVVDSRLSDFGKKVKFDSSFIRPEDFGFSIDLYRAATIALAKEAVKASVGPDVHLGQAVRAYDDLVSTSNLLSERLHEWYGFHFPELENVVSGDAYPKAVVAHGSKESVMSALGLKMDSIGSDVAPEDLESIRTLASALAENMSARQKVERYVELRMREVAPNISTLAGPVIGARLIMHAGSLGRLASMPSGTVQLLGAEKAMFRHLKDGSKPPKHGVLFTHSLVHASPPWQRGPIARALAAKICLAARADAYSHNDISGLLSAQLEKRVAEIRKQHAAPPKRPQKKAHKRGRR